jgi:HAD superfamily hydrolase (TIGR01484 family)
MGKIRLIALDMDGTILAQNTIITAVKGILRLLVERGIKVALVTGRELEDIKTILRANSFLDDYPQVIISEGAFIYYLRRGDYLPDEEWNLIRKRDLESLRRSIGRMSFEFADKVKGVVAPVNELIDEGIIYFAFETVSEAEEARLILEELTSSFELAKIIRNQRFVGLTCRTGLKGNSLLRVTNHYGFGRDEILAIGDSHNDEDMLNEEKGGLGWPLPRMPTR